MNKGAVRDLVKTLRVKEKNEKEFGVYFISFSADPNVVSLIRLLVTMTIPIPDGSFSVNYFIPPWCCGSATIMDPRTTIIRHGHVFYIMVSLSKFQNCVEGCMYVRQLKLDLYSVFLDIDEIPGFLDLCCIKMISSFVTVSTFYEPGDLKTRKRTGTSCQIEIHFSIKTTKFLFKYTLFCSQIYYRFIILFIKHNHTVSASYIKEKHRYK